MSTRLRVGVGVTVLGLALLSAGAVVPLRTVDSADAAVAAYARSVSSSSGGQVRLTSAVATHQRGAEQVIYRLRWHRPDGDLTLATVVQRRTYLGGVLSSWHVVQAGSAPAASSG